MIATVLNNFGPGIVAERFTLTDSDLTAAAASQTFNLKPLPRGSVIFGVRVKHTVAFGGGGATAVTIAVGSQLGATNTFLAASDIKAAVADNTFYVSGSGIKAGSYAADTLTATIAATGANVNALTSGSVNVDVFYWLMEDLSGTGPAGNSPSGGLL
jgi:hypothetical protein